jgi:hypothetical protein
MTERTRIELQLVGQVRRYFAQLRESVSSLFQMMLSEIRGVIHRLAAFLRLTAGAGFLRLRFFDFFATGADVSSRPAVSMCVTADSTDARTVLSCRCAYG